MSVTFSAKRNPTMVDIARGKVNGKYDRDIVELAIDSTENLSHFVVLEANDGNNDTTTIRTGIPSFAWTNFYEGVQPSKGSKAQVTNTCGHLEALLQVDARLIKTQEDATQELGDEAYCQSEGMGSEVLSTIFYGNTKVNGRKFNGLSPIYSTLCTPASTDKEASYYTLGAKRSQTPDDSALRSIWLVGHGRMGSALFYPKGTSAGLQRGPVTDQTVTTADGKRLRVKEQFFDWTVGFRCKDFRCNVRIANIESNNLESIDQDLGEVMLKAVSRARKTGVSHKFYMPKSVYEWLCVKTRRDVKGGGNFSFADFEGKLILHFHGIPIFTEQALETDEEAVA
jgi:hypothetical protein